MMKRRFIFPLMLCLLLGSVFGLWHVFRDKQRISYAKPKIVETPPLAPRQNTKQSTARRVEQEQTKETEDLYSGFVDKNGDGIIMNMEAMNPNLPWSHPDNVRARHKLMIANLKSGYTAEELEEPERKKRFELMESQEYLELRLNGASMNELTNFFADNGIGVRDFLHQPFREHFPTGVAADYEPEMRERLKSLIIENGGYDRSVLHTFLQQPETGAWYMSQFMSKIAPDAPTPASMGYDWMKNVETEALGDIYARAQKIIETGITPEAGDLQTSVESPETPTNTGTFPETFEPKMGEVSEDLKRLSENSDVRVELQQRLQKLPDARHRLLDALNEEEDIKAVFRDQFSPERFNRALQTLNQYGPEEGFRRLKNSDPEIATQMERLLQKRQADD